MSVDRTSKLIAIIDDDEAMQDSLRALMLTKGYSGCAPPDRIDVELDRSVAERDAFEYRIAAVQSHQAVIKTQLPEELRVLLSLPVVSRHGDRDRFRAPGKSEVVFAQTVRS